MPDHRNFPRQSAAKRMFGAIALAMGMAPSLLLAAAKPAQTNGLDTLADTIRTHDVTLICDDSHRFGDQDIALLASDAFLGRAKAAGVVEMELELPNEDQTVVERFQADPAKRDDLEHTLDQITFKYATSQQADEIRKNLLQLVDRSRGWNRVVFGDDLGSRGNYDYEQFLRTYELERGVGETLSPKEHAKREKKFEKRHASEIAAFQSQDLDRRVSLEENRAILSNMDLQDLPGHAIVNFGRDHAAAMKRILEDQGKTVAVVILHPDSREYRASVKSGPHLPHPLDMDRFSHFILDGSQFIPAKARGSADLGIEAARPSVNGAVPNF